MLKFEGWTPLVKLVLENSVCGVTVEFWSESAALVWVVCVFCDFCVRDIRVIATWAFDLCIEGWCDFICWGTSRGWGPVSSTGTTVVGNMATTASSGFNHCVLRMRADLHVVLTDDGKHRATFVVRYRGYPEEVTARVFDVSLTTLG